MVAHLRTLKMQVNPWGPLSLVARTFVGKAFEKPPRTFEKLSFSGGIHALSYSPERTLNDRPEYELMHSVVRKQHTTYQYVDID